MAAVSWPTRRNSFALTLVLHSFVVPQLMLERIAWG